MLLKFIEELGKCIVIAGFKEVKIENIEDFLARIQEEKVQNSHIQFFDARFVATWRHLYFAGLNALIAFKNNCNISRNVAIESMLYASAQRQIRKALNLLGVRRDSSEMAVMIITEEPDFARSALSNISKQIEGKRDNAVLALSKKKIIAIRKIFGISDVELEAIMKKDDAEEALLDLVTERMALLATQH